MTIPKKHAWKKRIALDIDGTLWDFYGPFFEFFNSKFGTNFTLKDFNKPLPQALGVSQEELNLIFDEFERSEFADNLSLYEDVYETLLNLSQKHFLICVTAKDKSHRELVINRLKKKFPKFDFPIYFSGDFVGASGKKEKICKEINAEIIIEDSPYNALNCTKIGIKAILLDRYWNKGIKHENLIRAKNWKEVLKIIEK